MKPAALPSGDASTDAGPAVHGVRDAPVVDLSLVRIGEHFIGLGYLLKPPLGVLVAWVLVRVPFHGHLTIGLLQLSVGRRLGDAERLVIAPAAIEVDMVNACPGSRAWLGSGGVSGCWRRTWISDATRPAVGAICEEVVRTTARFAASPPGGG
eukprot:scaffold1151_cov126-Isochrysis_galbana.AAC.9